MVVKIPSNTVTAIQQGGNTVTSVDAGTAVTDQATVTGSFGTPTGTVTFSFFSGDCQTGTQVGSDDTENLVNGVATSASSGALGVGDYYYLATYNGDGTYLTSTGSCEPLMVVKIPSNTVTAIKQGGNTVTSITAGTAVTDQATVTGSFGTPTGTVTFQFFSGDCQTGTQVGSDDTENLVNGVATSASSGNLSAGDYYYLATYNGDGTYLTSSGTCEPLTVSKLPSNTVTAIKQGGQTVTSVDAGTMVSDQATVTGSGPTPTGTVTFTFFSGTCETGTQIGSADPEQLVNGVANSGSIGQLTVGMYYFLASYGGDTTYLPSTGACEPLLVTQAFASNFTPGYWKTHDTATTNNLPQILGNYYTVTTYAQAKIILSGMGCGSVGPINCMAGMLLAAELNLQQGGSTCITSVIASANGYLTKYHYTGFKGYPNVTAADNAAMMKLHDQLSAYNIDGVPSC
jgi:hypothetical protein